MEYFTDALTTILWLRDFLLDQSYDVGPAVLYQDNMSTSAVLSKHLTEVVVMSGSTSSFTLRMTVLKRVKL